MKSLFLLTAIAFSIALPVHAQRFGLAAPAEAGEPRAPDYASPDAWACRPEAELKCVQDLDAVAISAAGERSVTAFEPATDAPIDCFYVYPTASREPRDYATIVAGPAIMDAIRTQAGRLASRCRLFAPLYRQATLWHLRHNPGQTWDGPYEDVLAAWNDYLEHDNHGRGVVLIGHSQGTIILQRLLASEVDGRPSQRRLVSAFLIGNPGLMVPPGLRSGGTFKRIPVCSSTGETGCAYAWASYFADDDAPRPFGLNKGGLLAACVSPANPAEPGRLDSYFQQRDFPPARPEPFAELPAQVEAACQSDSQGAVLRITIPAGTNALAIRAALDTRAIHGFSKDWGLHRSDLELAQGSILSTIDAETRTWLAAHR